jgi:FkbM family methyltransferase
MNDVEHKYATLDRLFADVNGRLMTIFHPPDDPVCKGTIKSFGDNQFAFEKVGFQPQDVMLDIGCNCGVVSLFAARMFPDIRIIAFDAGEVSCLCLKLAAATNKMTNIEVHHLAVGDANRKGVRFYSNGAHMSNLVCDACHTAEHVHFDSTVDMVAIDEIFDSPILNIDRVKYLKMDIEGAEYDIFDHLFEKRPDILDRIDYLHIERHTVVDRDPVALGASIKKRFGDRVFMNHNIGDQWTNPLHK